MRVTQCLSSSKSLTTPSRLLGLSHPVNKPKTRPRSSQETLQNLREFVSSHFASYPLSLIFTAQSAGFPHALNTFYQQLRAKQLTSPIDHQTHANVIDPALNSTLHETFCKMYPQIPMEENSRIVMVSLTSDGMHSTNHLSNMQEPVGMKLAACILSPQTYPFLKNATKEEGKVRENLNNVGKRGLVNVTGLENGALLLTKG